MKRSLLVNALVLVISILLIAGGIWAVRFILRPEVVAVRAFVNKAIDSVAGSVTVLAEREEEIKSEVGGRIDRSILEPGRRVAKDEVLVEIDSRDLDLEIARTKSELRAAEERIQIGSSARFELEAAEEHLRNLELALQRGAVPEAELGRQRRNVEQIKQRQLLEEVSNTQIIESLQNALQVKQRQREKMSVRAPFDGVISRVLAYPGTLIGPGSPIAVLISINRTVEARISEESFAGVREGQHASVRFLGYGAQLYGASVIKLLPTADPATQRYVVHLNVDLPLERLIPGITGEVVIVANQRDNALIIPRRALLGNRVWVVQGDRIEAREVELGYGSLNDVEVLSGLREGDAVVVEGLDALRDGDRVRSVEILPR